MTKGFRKLTVYIKSFELAKDISEITKNFPPEEKYGLTDQIRRSSRAVCRAIGEGYRKRQYPKHFSSKMSARHGKYGNTSIVGFCFRMQLYFRAGIYNIN